MSEVAELTAPPGRSARIAVSVVFFVHGVLFASWTAHIPEVKSRLGLTDGTLGVALLGAPVGSIGATILAGVVLARVGSRVVVQISAVGYCLAGIVVGVAGTLPLLFAGLALWGAFQGVLDVSMNAQAIAAERVRGRPIMSALHGTWSIGAFTGAGLGALGVSLGMSLTVQLLILGVPCVAAALAMATRFVPDPPVEAAGQGGGARRSRVLLVLGLVALAGLLCEGAVADWSAVYLRDTLHMAAGPAGLGYTIFAIAMVAVRMSGARLQRIAGPRRMVSVLAIVGAVGMAAGLAGGQPVTVIAGFAVLGVGLGVVVPVVFSAAGNQPGLSAGTAVATVSAIGWAGFMAGPPLIGFIAQNLSRTFALALLPALMLTVGVIAWRTTALDHAS